MTNSAQASSVALICLAVMFYMFFMLRQCYLANEEVNPKGCCGSTCTVLYLLPRARMRSRGKAIMLGVSIDIRLTGLETDHVRPLK